MAHLSEICYLKFLKNKGKASDSIGGAIVHGVKDSPCNSPPIAWKDKFTTVHDRQLMG